MSLTTPIFAGNWKLNHGPEKTRAFFRDFLPRLPARLRGTIVLCPPSISVNAAADSLQGRPDVLLGVQNIYWEASGAFTGEISAPLAKEAGAAVVLVGHSERRHVFGETDEECGKKVRSALEAGMVGVLCVGELLAEREAGGAFDRVARQVTVGLESVEPGQVERLVVAYEPVWAIGTGRNASPADASDMHRQIRELLTRMYGPAGEGVPILYGGSVKGDNAAGLLRAPGVDGLLIGGASLDPAGFAGICASRP